MAEKTLVHKFWERVAQTPERTAILYNQAGSYLPVSWKEHGRTVELVAAGLLSLGVKHLDKVAIMSQTCHQWTWADMAILSCGSVTVPIYPTLTGQEVQYLISHSDSIGVFVENERQLAKILECKSVSPALKFVIMFEPVVTIQPKGLRIISWDELLKSGEVFLKGNHNAVKERIVAIKEKDLASIVYTSGTTGVPKGALLLHSNFYSVCEIVCKLFEVHSEDLFLSFLPLSHVYERVAGQFLSIYGGAVTAYAESMENVSKNMLEVKPTLIIGVPRFYEKVYERAQTEIRNMPLPKQLFVKWAFALGKRRAQYYERAGTTAKIDDDEHFSQIFKSELRVADRLVFSKIRQRLGGRVRAMISGAAPLSEEILSFFQTIGLVLLEGYGLTETAAPLATNMPLAHRKNTVGHPFPCVQVKIAPDGELLVKGPTVFAGYYKNPEATKEALQDGWFRTGDIGKIDDDGYLAITDRKKDLIITSGGKHVAPQFIENLFRSESLISQIVIYGDKRNFITALITLNTEAAKAFAKANSIQHKDPKELANNPKIREEIQSIVDRKNEALASFERIKKFVILEEDFSIETNELTPTLKLKRKVIINKYKHQLDDLYDFQADSKAQHLAKPSKPMLEGRREGATGDA